jgi:hypothetical protein
MKGEAKRISRGPFKTEHLKPGDRYELSEGHSYYCAPTSGDGARGTVAAGQVLDTDPEVESSGFDAGFTQGPASLWAPDIAVGNVPDKPGWIKGAPLLGVEYAGVGQDEQKLREKIAELFAAGTRWIWVVRMVGPRRVEVHSPTEPMRTLGPGDELTAPGVLRNPVPVEALYDRGTAHEMTLRNLLQRKGYDGLEDLRQEARGEGREEGLEEGLEEGVKQTLSRLFARRLGRPLTTREQGLLSRHLKKQGADQIEVALLELEGDALLEWLLASNAKELP